MITYMSTSKTLLPVLPFSLLQSSIIHYIYSKRYKDLAMGIPL